MENIASTIYKGYEITTQTHYHYQGGEYTEYSCEELSLTFFTLEEVKMKIDEYLSMPAGAANEYRLVKEYMDARAIADKAEEKLFIYYSNRLDELIADGADVSEMVKRIRNMPQCASKITLIMKIPKENK